MPLHIFTSKKVKSFKMKGLTHSEELKIHTEQVHRQLEQRLIPLIQSVTTPSQYTDLLKIFYTFYLPLENRLSAVVGIENATTDIHLRKAESLKKDIIDLHDNTDNLFFCSDLPTCVNLSRAFGIMYVLEGSVLGGKTIANMIKKKLPGGATLPFSFFLHYGDDAKVTWQQFKTTLDCTENLIRPDILSAATDTFTLFKNWIDRNSTALFH